MQGTKTRIIILGTIRGRTLSLMPPFLKNNTKPQSFTFTMVRKGILKRIADAGKR